MNEGGSSGASKSDTFAHACTGCYSTPCVWDDDEELPVKEEP